MKKLIAVFTLFISVHFFAQQLTTNNPLVNDAFKLVAVMDVRHCH